MRNSQSKRLDKVEARLRQQYADIRKSIAVAFWDGFTSAEYAPMLDCLQRLRAMSKEEKVVLSNYFTECEIGLIHKAEIIMAQPGFLTMLEAMKMFDVALQACERVRA